MNDNDRNSFAKPLKFTEGQPAKLVVCQRSVVAKGGKWSSTNMQLEPGGYRLSRLPVALGTRRI
jgi:hypothetical protein